MSGKVAIKDAFSYGWEAFVRNFFFFAALFAISLFPLLLLEAASKRWEEASFLWNVVKLASSLWRILTAMAVLSACLYIFDYGKASLLAFSGLFKRFVPYFVVTTLYGLMLGLGLMVFVVPGLYLGVVFQFAPYLVLDGAVGPIEALKESASLTRENRWELFMLDVLVILANLGGAFLFGIGVVVTVPVTFLAVTFVYRRFLNLSGA